MKQEMQDYLNYHEKSAIVGDIDPQNPALKYICNRFELNLEQRYWLAFLFGCTYCAPTVYYIYNEFPDFENVDVGRLQRWWVENKDKCMFQTDRLRIKSSDKLVETFESYKNLMAGQSQYKFFSRLTQDSDKEKNYDDVFKEATKIRNFGRFSNFIYLELLYELCDLPIQPSQLDVKNADSCRNGLCYALGREDLIDSKISKSQVAHFEKIFKQVAKHCKKKFRKLLTPYSAWGIETTLCAYKKHKRGKRWIGYYVDRQADEIKKLQDSVKDGVNWQPLWDFRKEYFNHSHLYEITGERSSFEKAYL